MRMAVAFYVTGISTPEVHPEFPPLLGTLTIVGPVDSDGTPPATSNADWKVEFLGSAASTVEVGSP